MKTKVLLILLLFLITSLDAAELKVQVRNIDWQKSGRIKVGLYTARKGYLKPGYQVVNQVMDINGNSSLEFIFRDLPAGRYAAGVLHDENGNSLMDTGFLGIPLEGYGFSGVDKPGLERPSFNKVAVTLTENSTVSTSATMRYIGKK